jgi:hypothetical protein
MVPNWGLILLALLDCLAICLVVTFVVRIWIFVVLMMVSAFMSVRVRS